jgi:hypothetical protein
MQVSGRRVESGFDAQGLSPRKLPSQVLFRDEFIDAAQDDG